MNEKDVTEQILGAWDEDEEPTAEEPEAPNEDAPAEPGDAPAEPEQEEAEEEEEAVEEEPAEEEAEPEEAEEPAEEEEEAEGEPATAFHSDDPEVQAYLSKFQGDAERALKGAIQQQRAMSRIGQDKVALQHRVDELEAELSQTQALSPALAFLTEEQRTWVEEASASTSPIAYVQQAVRAGEFELARAVITEWARESPYEAIRAAAGVDQVEQHVLAQQQGQQAQAQNGAQAEAIDPSVLLNAIAEHYPDIPEYAPKMVEVIGSLGEGHPLVQDSRSSDPDTAIRGVIGIYEIARAQNTRVADARAEVKSRQRQEATQARKRAVVSSAQKSPTPGESPKPTRLGPGLTLEALDSEWANE